MLSLDLPTFIQSLPDDIKNAPVSRNSQLDLIDFNITPISAVFNGFTFNGAPALGVTPKTWIPPYTADFFELKSVQLGLSVSINPTPNLQFTTAHQINVSLINEPGIKAEWSAAFGFNWRFGGEP